LKWVEQGLENGLLMRDDRWSESIAVGSLAFIDQVKNELGFRVEPGSNRSNRSTASLRSKRFTSEYQSIGI
jgi:hypothetical protein